MSFPRLPPRRIPVPALLLALALPTAPAAFSQEAFSQEAPPAAAPSPALSAAAENAAAPDATTPRSSLELRSDLGVILRDSPSELGTILALDPTLLSNDAYLASYPRLAGFVAEHPEVRRNPRFYLAEFAPADHRLYDALEPLLVLAAFGVIAIAAAWLIRTLIEQRRWTRLSRTQSEVHNKILEKFGTSEALLEYMRSPPGARFLESAPIPLHAEQAMPGAPFSRALWSIQLGVIVAAGAVGLLFASSRFDAASAQGIVALGIVALCLGVGFITSALVSVLVSRRLGLWAGPGVVAGDGIDDAGSTR